VATRDSRAPFQAIRFLTSVPYGVRPPPDRGREVAFAGRSNSGKSSAINALTGRRGLARASRTPGRTQAINFFELDGERRLVDLPGYGYARVPEAMQRQWRPLIEGYLGHRHSLKGIMLTVDCRREPTELEALLLDWAQASALPLRILLSKADKLGRGTAAQALRRWRELLAERGGGEVEAQLFSSLTGAGVEEARLALLAWLDSGQKKAPA
jgi:GTP-binding protein